MVGPVQVVRLTLLPRHQEQTTFAAAAARDSRPPPALRMHLATHTTTVTTNTLLYYYASRETPLDQTLNTTVNKNHSVTVLLKPTLCLRQRMHMMKRGNTHRYVYRSKSQTI